MSNSCTKPALQQVWPAVSGISPEHMALAALRHEIDQIDDDE